MELYEAWQRRKWKKFVPDDPYRASGELVHDHANVPDERRPPREHELHPVGSQEYTKAGRRPPDAVFQVEKPPAQPSYHRTSSKGPQALKQRPLAAEGNGSKLVTANVRAVDNIRLVPNPATLSTSDLLSKSLKEVTSQQQDGDQRGWKVHHNPTLSDEMDQLGGTRHILRDFQDQLQTLRAQIALLSTQNGVLRHKLSEADKELMDAASSNTLLLQELESSRGLLQSTQGDLKVTKNRESRLQRLQESLKQLVDEKDSRLNNGALNSRATAERHAALRSRIEDLERQLAEQQANGNDASHTIETSDQEIMALPNGHTDRGAATNARSIDAGLLVELQRLQMENKALQKKLLMQDKAAKRAAEKACAEAESLGKDLATHTSQLAESQRLIQDSRASLLQCEGELAVLKCQQASAAAELASSNEQNTSLRQEVEANQSSLEEAVALRKAVNKTSEDLRNQHQQVIMQLSVLQEQQAKVSADHLEAVAKHAGLREEHTQLHTKHVDLQSQHKAAVSGHAAAIQELQQQSEGSTQQHQDLLRQHAYIQAKYNDAAQQVALLQSQQARIQADAASLQSQKKELEREHAALQQLLSNERDKQEALQSQNKEHQSRHAESQQLLSDVRDQHAALQQQHRDLWAKHDMLEAGHTEESTNLQQQIAGLRDQVASVKCELEEARSTHGSTTSTLTALQADHEEMIETLAAIRAAHDATKVQLTTALAETNGVKEQVTAAVGAHQEASRGLAEANLSRKALQDQVLALGAIVGDLESDLSTAREAKQQTLHAHETKKVELAAAFKQLADAIAAREELASQLESESAARASVDAKLAESTALLKEERKRSDQHAAAASKAEGCVADLQAKLDGAKEELAAAQQRLVMALSSVDEEQAVTLGVLSEAQGRGVLVDQLQRELDAALAEGEVFEQQYAEQARAIEEWEKQAATLRSELEARNRELSAVRHAAQQANEAAAAETSRYKALLDAAKVELATRERIIEEVQRKKDAATSEALAAKQAAAGLEMDLTNAADRLASEAAMAASNLEAVVAREHAMEEQLASLKRSHSEQVLSMQRQAADLSSSREEAIARASVLQEQLSSYQKALTEASLQHDAAMQQREEDLRQQTADAERRISGFEASTSKLETELSRATAESNSLATQLKEQASAAAVLKADHQKQAKNAQFLEAELSKLRTTYSELASQKEEAGSQLLVKVKELEGMLSRMEAKEQTMERDADQATRAHDSKLQQLDAELSTASTDQAARGSQLRAAQGLITEEQEKAEAHRREAERLAAALAALTAEYSELRTQHGKGVAEMQAARDAAAVQMADAAKLAAEYASLAAQHTDLDSKHSAALAEGEQSKAEAAAEKELAEKLRETVSRLEAELASALSNIVTLSKEREDTFTASAQHKEAAAQLQSTLDGTHRTHHQAVEDLHAIIKEMREAPERDHAALSFELWRLVQENDMLRARVHEYEADVQHLVNQSKTLGHSNPKQKIQYHLRWKQELEELRNECTLLLRERFQLEQCIRYLAVRCGLSIAVERDVTASRERTPLDKLQPASLVPHYKFAAHAAHVTDAAGDHVTLEDLTDDATERGSPTASERGSTSTALSNKPDLAVEHQILARVAFVCNPPPNKLPDNPLRPSLTPGALLALPSTHKRDPVREWDGGPRKAPSSAPSPRLGSSLAAPKNLDRLDKPASSQDDATPPESSAGSSSEAGSLREEGGGGAGTGQRKSSVASESGQIRSSMDSLGRSIPKLTPDAPSSMSRPASTSERLTSRIGRAFTAKMKM